MLRGLVGQIDVQNIEDQDFRGMPTALSGDCVCSGDVFGEVLFSPLAVISSAARADFMRAVSDDPRCPPCEPSLLVALFRFKPQSGIFCWSRHLTLISLMFRSVV